MPAKVLLIHYSQSGQLTEIARRIGDALGNESCVAVTQIAIKPKKAYPFPWKPLEFIDVFPESLLEEPCPLEPLATVSRATFDLIVLGYQVWYLSPSIPVASFLRSPEAARVMQGKPVVTLIGCRNMWLLAQEKVKARLADLEARLVGNIVLTDRTPNLVGVITIAAWMLTGRKERFLPFLPQPGIDAGDIASAARFAEPLGDAIKAGRYGRLQRRLNTLGACEVQPELILFEHRISKVFRVWAHFIRRKGGAGAAARKPRLRLFMAYLLAAVFLLAPIATLATTLIGIFKKERLRAAVTYYRSCQFNPKAK